MRHAGPRDPCSSSRRAWQTRRGTCILVLAISRRAMRRKWTVGEFVVEGDQDGRLRAVTEGGCDGRGWFEYGALGTDGPCTPMQLG